jgi:hypothetical protein
LASSHLARIGDDDAPRDYDRERELGVADSDPTPAADAPTSIPPANPATAPRATVWRCDDDLDLLNHVIGVVQYPFVEGHCFTRTRREDHARDGSTQKSTYQVTTVDGFHRSLILHWNRVRLIWLSNVTRPVSRS